ncbi:MAG: sulfur carrier protein ThiS [Dehalococcoidales bacterium]|nr:sulfur carrier protein ThiS [Dehalococcoidales bacterium]
MVQVKINGAVAEIPDNHSIDDLLLARKLPRDIVIIELNGEIIKRENWESLKLNPSDSLEIIRIIGGG